MSKRPIGTCVLCNNTRELCMSHVISGFAYKPLCDNKNRFISFEPVAPEKQRVLQSGYSSYLLCEECETLRNRDYEQPFQLEWIEGKAIDVLRGKRSGHVTGITYSSLKLFHLSTLLLASKSTCTAFSCVRLDDAHSKRIREMVYNGDAGPENEYPIICCIGEVPDEPGKIWDEIINVNAFYIKNIPAFGLTFLGCTWICLLTKILTPDIYKLCLKSKGDMPVVRHQQFFEQNLMSNFKR